MEFPRPDEGPELEDDLEFQVVDWFVPENDRSKQGRDKASGYQRPAIPTLPAEYEIFMYGVTAEGYTVTAKVVGYQPYFFVKVPQHWTKKNVSEFHESILMEECEMKRAAGGSYTTQVVKKSLRDHLVSMKLVERKDFWGFTNFEDFKFMKVTVKSLRLFNDLKRYFQTKPGFQLYESNIDPFLRFIHERGIQPCGWVRIPADTYTVIDVEAEQEELEEAEAKTLQDIDDRKYVEWKVARTPCHARTTYCVTTNYESVYGLGYNKIAPLLIASFDIECTSSHGDFPVAIKNYRKLTMDLLSIARKNMAEFTVDNLRKWIPKAFSKEISKPDQGVHLHRLYAKSKVSREYIETKVAAIAEEIIAKTRSILAAKSKNSKQTLAESDDSDDSDGEQPSANISSTDADLTALLTKNLPALAGDPIIQIGTTVHRYGSDRIIYRHITTLKSCTDIPDAEVEAFDTEEDVLKAWKNIIIRLDPDIITGYNIFGFDTKYIADRAKELGIYDELVEGLGRLKHRHCDLEEKRLSSSALGDNIMYCFDLDGIVQIDMLKVMQRDHKLDSYKLDAVAAKFITESATVVDSSTLRTANNNGLKEGNYIRIDGTSSKLQVASLNPDNGHISLMEPIPTVFAATGQKLTWSLVKDDITPNEIFAKFGGTAADRQEVAKYCLQDCALVNRLLHKLKVLENNIGMGNVCYVPLTYLFMRGQGVKIFSLVARECRLKKHLIPTVKSARDTLDDEVGYEGAIVLPPQEGMYLDDPITVLDYSSLYPSSMIARNISHDALVIDPSFRSKAEHNGSGITFHDVTFDEYEGTGDKKRIKGQKTCTFAQFPEGKKGIVPSILQMLLTQRKNTRKKIEYETVTCNDGREVSGLIKPDADGATLLITDVDSGNTTKVPASDVMERRDTFNEFEKAVLDARQLAYKVTANSLYGQTGSRTSPIYLLEVAACTTATGREMIMLAKGFVEKQYNAHVIYGDSVMPYTPILLRNKNTTQTLVKTIESLAFAEEWESYDAFKAGDSNRKEKQQAITTIADYQVWTHKGWSDIKRVIRHKCNKAIYRVLTHTGLVDVTEDHSLLDADANRIKPTDVTVGTKLLHSFPESRPMMADLVDQEIVMWDQLSAQEHYLLLKAWGYNVSVSYDNGLYRLSGDTEPSKPSNCEVKKIEKLHDSYNDFVYDIETEVGVFQAGIGDIIVKNTDSIFCKFPNEGKKGREALPLAIAAGQLASKEIKSILPPPQCLEYEKTLWPFILFSKKRYVGNLYEDDHTKKPKQKSMGIVLKRRDNAPIVKRVYGGIIDILMNKGDLTASVDFLKRSLQDLVDGKVPLEELVISKTLKGDYKDPTKIAHKVLADRMGERDPGNKPMVNDRIPFVYIVPPAGNTSKLQGDRIEHPDYIRANLETCKPDYQFYITNQLLKPVSQLFALCVSKIEGYDLNDNHWEQVDAELEGTRLYTDDKKRKERISRLKMKEVKILIFDKYITLNTPSKSRKRLIKGIEEIKDPEYLTLEITAQEKKRGNLYNCTCIVKRVKKDDVAATDGPIEVWKATTEYKGRKADTLRMAAVNAVSAISQDATMKSLAVIISCPDKAFIKMWRTALKLNHDGTDAMKEVKQSLDDGLLEEQTALRTFDGLVKSREVVNYILQ